MVPDPRRTGDGSRWRSDLTLPSSHADLLDRALPTVVTTEMPDGRLRSTVVWCNRDGDHVLLNTMRELQKARNLETDPRATLLLIDPDDDGRRMEARGDVDLVADGAEEHLDRLTRRYRQHERFYGFVYPLERREREARFIARIHPRRIVRDAIH